LRELHYGFRVLKASVLMSPSVACQAGATVVLGLVARDVPGMACRRFFVSSAGERLTILATATFVRMWRAVVGDGDGVALPLTRSRCDLVISPCAPSPAT
jgi:hypothetical protein